MDNNDLGAWAVNTPADDDFSLDSVMDTQALLALYGDGEPEQHGDDEELYLYPQDEDSSLAGITPEDLSEDSLPAWYGEDAE